MFYFKNIIYFILYIHLKMVIYTCSNCNKEFKKKYNFNYHINNKIRPCSSLITYIAPKDSSIAPKDSSIAPKDSSIAPKDSSIAPKDSSIKPLTTDLFKNALETQNINNILLNEIEKLVNSNLTNKKENNTCMYCDTTFTRNNNLQRHIKERCKSKMYYDELEKLKIKFDSSKKEIEELKKQLNTNNSKIITTNNNNSNNTNNTLNNNQINNGTINNNNLNVQLVQFGSENIDDLDIKEALNIYLKSTGGNIVSNMLKFVNLNEKYPQNHNICMSDLSRELVKIFNGKQFIVKKFKDAKSDILGKAIVTTYKIVDKIENNNSIKKTTNDKSKMKINKVSLKLINGTSAEDIVREEIREAEKLLKDDDILLIANDNEGTEVTEENEEEREFTNHEQMRIEHLENKQQGLQEITLERLKEELYNGRYLVICD